MGKLIVVGIGPGNYENMTIKADRALQSCDVIIGYHVYVDLVKERYSDKEFLTTPMTQETKRCQMAIDLARQGKTVAMVCSGDSGIYGMAALIYELRGECSDPEVEVIPGLTAACSGAAWALPSHMILLSFRSVTVLPVGENRKALGSCRSRGPVHCAVQPCKPWPS